jgi:hypothetical protein
MKTIFSILSIMVITISLAGLNLVSCSGGGGAGGVAEDTPVPPTSGTGTGAGGIPIFWMAYGDPNLNSGGASVQQTPDGGFIAAGTQQGGIYLIRTNSSGAKQWENTIGGDSPGIEDSANCIRQTSDGGYIIAGLRRSGIGDTETHAFYLLRIDANGNALPGWPKTFPGSSPEHNGAADVIESQSQSGADGFGFVGLSADYKAYIAKVDRDGNTKWSTLVPHDPVPGGRDAANAIVQNPDGGFTVAGWVQKGGTPNYARVIQTDKDGNILPGWPKSYGQGAVFDIKSTQDNGFILVGTTSGGSPNEDGDTLVIKLDNQGNESWRTISGGSRDDAAYSVAPLSGGSSGYIIAGKSASHSQDDTNEVRMYKVDLIKIDVNGNKVWEKVKGIDPGSLDTASEVQLVSDGGYIIAGGSQNHFLLAKMDANGDTVSLGANDLTVTVTTEGSIKYSNARNVAGIGINTMDNLREIGAFGLDMLIEVKNNPALNSNGLSISPAPTTLSSGQTYTITLTNYGTSFSGDPATLNGSLTLTITNLIGDLSGDYTANITVASLHVDHTDDSNRTLVFDGGVQFSRVKTGGTISETSHNYTSSGNLTITMQGVSETVKTFIITRTTSGGNFSLGATGDLMQFELAGIPGTLALSVVDPIVGNVSDSVHPQSGKVVIKAADNSTVTLNVSTGGVVKLDIDTNADGTVDGSITTTFDELY